MRSQALANLREPFAPPGPIVGGGAHLDQLVGLERPVDLGHDLVGEPLVADDHDGVQFVRFGAQFAAALGRKRSHRGSISK
jgi:hypothetical protein